MRIPLLRGLQLPLFALLISGLCSCGGDTQPDPSEDLVGEVTEVGGPGGGSGSRDSQAATPGLGESFLPRSFPRPGAELLDEAKEMDLDEAFRTVARGIRYEPYPGVLRGAAGTALAGARNDLDQAILLAKLLARAGYRTRFARGPLGPENQAILLRGMTAPVVPEFGFTPDFRPYNPISDPALVALTQDHFWIEVFQTPEWLPLDASFPRAEPGEAYAQPQVRFDEVPQDLYQTVRISYHEETVLGGEKELGVIEGTTLDLGLLPISLSVKSVPQSPAGPPEMGATPGGITGGIAGALSGGAPAEEGPEPFNEDDLVGISYRRTLMEGVAESTLSPTGTVNLMGSGYSRRR